MSRQPYEIMADAMLKLESAARTIPVRPAKPTPLCQYELLLLAHPVLQSGGAGRVKEMPQSAAQGWMTIDVHGRVRDGVIEDMRCMVQGEDIESSLPDSILQEITRYVLNN